MYQELLDAISPGKIIIIIPQRDKNITILFIKSSM